MFWKWAEKFSQLAVLKLRCVIVGINIGEVEMMSIMGRWSERRIGPGDAW